MNWMKLFALLCRSNLKPVQPVVHEPSQPSVIFSKQQESESMQTFYTTELVLKRGHFGNSNGQIGELFDERGKFICHILEDPEREVKIYGETAIPAGTYQLEANTDQGRAYKFGARWSWHEREVWHLLDVKGFKYVQVHTGNTPADTLGCLLTGVWDGRRVYVGSSVSTYRALYRRYSDRVRAGVVSIRIEDAE